MKQILLVVQLDIVHPYFCWTDRWEESQAIKIQLKQKPIGLKEDSGLVLDV